jgi:hypothetical protein
MIRFFIPLIFYAGFLFLFPAPVCSQDSVGVSIRTTTEPGMFPRKWYGKKIDARAESLDSACADLVEKTIRSGLSKYPAPLLTSYLERVYVARSLRFYGFPYGGTYSKKRIYLTYDSSNPNYTARSLEFSLHHELSSILWKENMSRLKPKEWMALNPDGFMYGEGGTNAIRSGVASMDYEPGLFMIGFLNDYSVAGLEQDINVFAQNLFAGGDAFWKIADEHSPILAKARLLIRFYHTLDPKFTEDYFRQIE